MRVSIRSPRADRGAALVMVLLMVVLVFILVLAMLTATTNEVAIAGLYRDSVVALEHAQAGLSEAFVRMTSNPPRPLGTCLPVEGTPCTFFSSLDSNTTVTVIVRQPGVNFAVKEIQADSSVGRARRHLSMLVVEETPFIPPNFIMGESVDGQGSNAIKAGNVYSRQYVDYKSLPESDQTITYAGGWIGKQSGGTPAEENAAVLPCFDYPCTSSDPNLQDDVQRWYPAHRRAAYSKSCGPGVLLVCDNDVNGNGDGTGWAVKNCEASKDDPTWGTQAEFNSGTLASGKPASSLGTPPPLCGTDPDGLMFRWVKDKYVGVDKDPDKAVDRWFKTIVFEDWLNAYYDLTDEGYKPKTTGCPDKCLVDSSGNIITDPASAKYGVVPPFPNLIDQGAFNVTLTPDGVKDQIPADVIGVCKNPDPVTFKCKEGSIFTTVLADDFPPEGDGPTEWTMNKMPAEGAGGAGVLVVRGDLRLEGTLVYYGTIIVYGTVFAAGNMTIYGGLMAQKVVLDLKGNFSITSGAQVSNVPIGVTNVTAKAWWER